MPLKPTDFIPVKTLKLINEANEEARKALAQLDIQPMKVHIDTTVRLPRSIIEVCRV